MSSPPLSLAGKVAIVTGAGRGIGAATARRLAQDGAAVILAARTTAELNQEVAAIIATGGQARAVPTDIGDAAAVAALMQSAITTYGRLDILVNNAGMAGGNKPLVDVSVEVFAQVMATNLTGIFLGMKYAIPHLMASGGGAIVNVSSTVGIVGTSAGIAPYIASKHGVVGLTRAAALEYARANIRVNAVAPGTTLTSVNAHWINDPQIHQRIISGIPLGRVAAPAEVAEAIFWLCSPGSSYVTGVVLPVDGGTTAQ